MNDSNQDNLDIKLWRRYRQSVQPAGEPVDANELAAYLDGTADEAAVAGIEARMASDEAFLTEVRQLRQMRQASAEAVSESLLRRIKALAEQPSAAAVSRPQIRWWANAAGWWQRLSYTAAAAAVVLACLAGYSLGQGTFRARYAVETAATAQLDEAMQEIIDDPGMDLAAGNGAAAENGGQS